MRLLNTHNLKLESFSDHNIPAYAILSHRWQDGEVLFEDLQPGGSAEYKAGYAKLQQTCMMAFNQGTNYIWIDTCCIDKSSSAELSESINSMFAWYRKARMCYVYMFDVPSGISVFASSYFRDSEWFKRGWTLQELVAPQEMEFYSHDWTRLGYKNTLTMILTEITGIDAKVLLGQRSLDSLSIAKKMSWAAARKTTRVEDEAYCLMGLFDVNMPMIYGKGKKAFIRLQEEIMKDSDDESLFAWIDKDAKPDTLYGVLATSPANFAGSGNIVPYRGSEFSEPFTKTNKGLRLSLRLTPNDSEGRFWTAEINCMRAAPPTNVLGIKLKRLAAPGSKDSSLHQFARVCASTLPPQVKHGALQTFYVHQNITPVERYFLEDVFALRSLTATQASRPYMHSDTWVRESVQAPPAQLSKQADSRWPRNGFANVFYTGERSFFPRPSSGASRLDVLLGFSVSEKLKFVLLLGWNAIDGIVIDGIAVDSVQSKIVDYSIDSFKPMFSPKVPGYEFAVGRDSVRVEVSEDFRLGRRFYMVDITISLRPTLAPLKLKSG